MGVVVVAQVSGRGSVRVLLWVSVKLFNKGRLPRNCIHTACVSLRFLDAIPRNDDIYIRVAEILPLSFHFSVRLWCGY